MLRNTLKHALQEGRAVFGVGLTGPIDLPTLRIVADAGVEWIFTDLEHGSLDISELLTVVQAADILGMCAVPRIPSLEYHWVARALDTGALSVMVPRVESAAQAELAVQWCKFPPVGVRGQGSPSFLSYASVSGPDSVEISNRETLVAVQIETAAGVRHVEEIAAVPGVDVLFIGPRDLSISLGHPGDSLAEDAVAAYRKVCAVARARGLAVGIVWEAAQTAFLYEMGVRMFSCGSALGYMRAGVNAAQKAFRQQIEGA